ncbi:MAG: tetratricopeptide repeat protein [Candidatus Sulfotelmatobacter sp.]
MICRFMIFRVPCIWLFAACVMTLSVAAQDQDIAVVRRKAEAGDAIAQFDLAKAYMSGTGVATDPNMGLVWLQKSAAQDYFGAEYALGRMYQNGLGKLPKDQHEAASWFRKAAKQQNQASQDRLSEMLAQGLISAEEANWRAAEATVSNSPKKPTKSKAAPFTLIEVETGLTGGITSKRMATLVQKFGVDFKLTAVARKRLADEGADDNLLQTISASKRLL